MAPTIVYVHGNGNKVEAERLRSQWDRTLFGRDLGGASRMAYWASLRYARPLESEAWEDTGAVPDAAAGVGEAELAVADPETFIAEVLLQAQQEAPMAGMAELAGAAPIEAWLRDMTYTAEALAAGEDSEVLGAGFAEALPLPRRLRLAAFRALVKRAFEDVYAYFFGGMRDPMRKVVREALTGAGEPLVVLGHSLGSIIAYDALLDVGATVDVPLFVTVGSPLGVTEVQDLLKQPLRVPGGVRSWRNVSDARDLVALDHRIRPEYAPVDRCADFFVTNTSPNFHGIEGYLRTAPVRDAVLQVFG
ncbi:hypothetical protein [Actinoplanes sp. URMC 104]|uniref:hypothetical protein n=1 Tax=Actinoplanes sp. URMC 104 TaxID=3423409 RepID=UPI003F1DA58A